MKVTIEIDGSQFEVDLPEETFAALQAIAARNNITFGAALQQSIENEKFLEDQTASGAKLLIEKDQKIRELVRS